MDAYFLKKELQDLLRTATTGTVVIRTEILKEILEILEAWNEEEFIAK